MSEKTNKGNGVKSLTLSATEKFIVSVSAKHVQKRLLSKPYKIAAFNTLTMRQQLEYFQECASNGIVPDVSKDVKISLKGVYGVEYLLELFALVRKYDDNTLLGLYVKEFTEGTEEARKLALYLETGIIAAPSITETEEWDADVDADREEGSEE